MAPVDPRAYDETGIEEFTARDKATPVAPRPYLPPELEDHRNTDEATRLASLDGMAAMERARKGQPIQPGNDERTRAVNIRNDPSISDVDWDLD
jgi:hypothetical protein